MSQFFRAVLGKNQRYKMYKNFSDPLLIEHSLFGNLYIEFITNLIEDSPASVFWIGDYALEEANEYGGLPNGLSEQLVEDIIKNTELVEPLISNDCNLSRKHDQNEEFLVNLSKKVFINLTEYHSEYDLMHPLPILTAIGNGQSDGDYYGSNINDAETWAGDTIFFTRKKTEFFLKALMYKEVKYRFSVIE